MRETGPGHFGAIDKNLTPSPDILKDAELENAQKLNDLIKQKAELLEAGPERGSEMDFENKLQDLENMIKQLEDKV